jgi:(S)-mandelate dehydrogenase
VPFVLSTASTDTVEDVARVSAGEVWFQLYVLDRAAARELAERAWNADCRTLVLTVDVAVNGDRLRDKRSGFGVPFRYTPRIVLDAVGHPRWSLRQLAHGLPELAHFRSGRSGGSVEAQAALMQRQMDASFDWDALSALRDSWRGDLLVKGVLHPDDTRRCLALGADGVIVSNHGGRQFEQSPSALDALATMRASIDGPLLMDSGVRSGSDVLVALALGARAVLIGRPFLYALAAAGEAGVDAMFALLREQFDRALALAGCARADTVATDLGLS